MTMMKCMIDGPLVGGLLLHGLVPDDLFDVDKGSRLLALGARGGLIFGWNSPAHLNGPHLFSASSAELKD